MSTESFDPVKYKTQQRQIWDAVSSGWRKWWRTYERGAQHLSDRLLELADIQAGQRVLDIATGIGEPAVTAARRVGPAGHVVAIDQAPQMLAIAWERAAELGLQNIDFVESDAEVLNFPEQSFDAILCRWGLMFLPNLPVALRQIRGFLVSGGHLAAAVWDVPDKVRTMSLYIGVARQVLGLPPPPPGTPSLFSLADVPALEEKLKQAGFTDVHTERLTVTFEFLSTEAFVEFSKDISAALKAMLADQPAERQEAVWEAIAKAAKEYAAADGTIRMPNEAICVVGRR